MDNDLEYIDWPVDGFSAYGADPMRFGNLYLLGSSLSLTFSSTFSNLLSQGTLAELVSSSVTASTFDQVRSLNVRAYENANGTGAMGTLVEQAITSVSFQVTAIPEPAGFSAIAGLVAASFVLSGRRQRRIVR